MLALSVPLAVAVSLSVSGWASFTAVVYSFVFLPLIEFLVPVSKDNVASDRESRLSSDPYYDWILWLMVPIQYSLLYLFCHKLSLAEDGADGISFSTFFGMVSAFGISCSALGINVAHELGHRKSQFERVLARVLLASSLNWQFYVEHNRGHHKFVGTPGDSETSRLNETLYAFWFRAIRDSFLSALKRDRWEIVLGLTIEVGLVCLITLSFGRLAALGFVGSAFLGILLLQSVNYIEHYGLTRAELSPGVYESIRAYHSWNSSHALSRAFLFELSRHSDHHAFVTRKYPILRHLEESPQLPAGYPAMILLALLPPVWFRTMNPLVAENLRLRSAAGQMKDNALRHAS